MGVGAGSTGSRLGGGGRAGDPPAPGLPSTIAMLCGARGAGRGDSNGAVPDSSACCCCCSCGSMPLALPAAAACSTLVGGGSLDGGSITGGARSAWRAQESARVARKRHPQNIPHPIFL